MKFAIREWLTRLAWVCVYDFRRLNRKIAYVLSLPARGLGYCDQPLARLQDRLSK